MSEIKSSEPVYVPAVFPNEGRLPRDMKAVRANYRLQMAAEHQYRQQENAVRGGSSVFTCAHSLHISLFFDGTNNNDHPEVPVESRLRQTFFLWNSIITPRDWL